ncbi:MAG: hypothetical protein J6A01_08685 [Proteobacteria bacterium]|nr:hypothetical protein [Pseudomonadota bacterium]
MLPLILSILALFSGVCIYPVIKRHASLLSFFDAFALLALLGLTLLHLIPHSAENGGILGVIAVLVGIGIPTLLHHLQHSREEHEHKTNGILLIIVFIGIIIHTLLDGIGLSMSGTQTDMGQMLGLGVLFHRLPVGIFLSLVLVPQIGLKKTWAIAGAFAISTLVGFLLGHFALPSAGLTILYIVQGLIAGALLHIILHNVAIEGHNESHWPKGLGALAGFVTLAIVEWIAPESGHHHDSVFDIWITYLAQAAPFWCAALGIVGLCYCLSHSKQKQLSKFGHKACAYLDPQPLPAAFNGKNHFLNVTGLILLCTLFAPAPAFSWWLILALCLSIFYFSIKPLACCEHCRPESLCDRKKSFALWTASSWAILAGSALIAAVLPIFFSPVVKALTDIPAGASIAALLIILVIFAWFMVARRGLSLPAAVFAGFALLSLFHPLEKFCILLPIFSILCVVLYDYHPRDIAASRIEDKPWIRRYLTASLLCLSLVTGASYLGLRHLSEQEDTLAYITTIEPIHDHHEYAHETEHEHHEHAHETEHEHHEHVHENELDHHEHEHASIVHVLSQYNTVHLITLFVFILTGLFWMFRMGPRHLFETALGHHHHEHE